MHADDRCKGVKRCHSKKKKADIWSTRNSDTHCYFRKSKKYLILMGFQACSTNPLFPWSSDKTKWESSPVNYAMNYYNL